MRTMVKGRRALCVAHRGGALLAPENTLAAFQNALNMGVEAVELDVQLTHDGKLIVFHDSDVERLTDGSGNILDLEFSYLRSLNVAAHFRSGWPTPEYIPTLYEVLELVKEQARVFIELKYSERNGQPGRYKGIVEAVLADISALAMMDQVVLISFDWALLALAKTMAPGVSTAMVVGDESWKHDEGGAVEMIMDHVRELQCEWIDMQHKLLTSEMVQRFHGNGLQVAVWTVNTQEALRSYIEMGVDAITTDRPDLCMHL